jgi:O-acetylserine/cysteine efflux transporter
MSTAHLVLALVLAAMWGVNFVVIKIGLDHLPPLLFSALRFLAAAVPAILFLRTPGVPWRWVALVALLLGVLQFGLLFSGMAAGMPPGLTSLVVQVQAPFTAIFAMALLGERLGRTRVAGLSIALAGVVLIALDLGATSPLGAFLLVLGAAAAWGLANVAMKRAQPPDMLAFMVWVSALSVLPLLVLSGILEGPQRDLTAVREIPWAAVGSILFVGLIATVLGFGIWGYLIRTYSASAVAPFSLLVPVFGMASSALLLHEHIGPLKLVAGALIVTGVLAGAFSRTPARSAPLAARPEFGPAPPASSGSRSRAS